MYCSTHLRQVQATSTPTKPAQSSCCFICHSAPTGHLRCVFPNAALPQTSSTATSILQCFAVDLLDRKENVLHAKICDSCKKKLSAAEKFRQQILAAVGQPSVANDSVMDMLGCSSLIGTPSPLSTPAAVRTKRMASLNFTPTPVKRDVKKQRAEAKCSLNFNESLSEHSYFQVQTASEKAADLISGSSSLMLSQISSPGTTCIPRHHLLSALQKNISDSDIVNIIMADSILMDKIEATWISNIHTVCDHLCSLDRAPGPSVLRRMANAQSMQEEDILSESAVEFQRCLPLVFNTMTAVCKPLHCDKVNTTSTIGMIYAMAMHNRNNQLNAAQKLNTAAAVRLHANNDLLAILHKIGITLAAGSKYAFLDQLGCFNTDRLVRSLQKRLPGKITMDNVDGLLIANQVRMGSGNQHYHYAASTYYPDRCRLDHLSMATPQLPDALGHAAFFLTQEEEKSLKKNYGYQV